MDDYLNGLPDDISPNIISFLTVRDSCKVRCLLLGWKDLPDTRSVLRFDGYTIFGEENFCLASQDQRSKFVKAVDQFFKFWVAPKASALNVKFGLGNEYASHIDGWFESIRGKEVEELNLDFLFHYRNSSEKYVFPCHLLETEKAPHLKHLRLQFCDMKLICDTSARWLSSLSTLELACVSIRSSQLECILSSSTNLETLILRSCGFTERLLVQHTALKKLVIEEHSQRVHLICPKLKAFEFSGSCILTFSLFSFLREASFNFFYNRDGFFDFGSLSRNAPQLQTLSLWLSEKVPTLPLSMAMSNLKRLNLFLHIQQGFDFLTITHMLRISPVLEELNLKLKTDIVTVLPPERQDLHRHPPHFHLKVLRVTFGMVEWSMFGLVEYLLRVSVSLQQMVLVVGADAAPFLRRHHMFSKLTYINPDVEFTII